MKYRIIVDSCGDLTEELKMTGYYESAPLTIDVDGYQIIDDETFDQADFLRRVDMSPNCPKSSCPSPECFRELIDCEAENVYIVTLSGNLSGSYNSAVLAVKLFKEENSEKNVCVIDSKSASIGMTLISLVIKAGEESGLDFDTIVKNAEAYRDEMNTFFVLESLETLRKNGRLSNLKAFVANKLNIKPVMAATKEGTIYQLGQAIGINKALSKMVDLSLEKVSNTAGKIAAIAHCNNLKRAEWVKSKLMEKGKFREIFIVNTGGISSMYANEGGIIVAF